MSKIIYEPQTYFDLIDRSEWQLLSDNHQPWFNEPDEVAFLALGYRAAITRNNMGILCGYIAINVEHPWFGHKRAVLDIEVHGGLTYSGFRVFKSIFYAEPPNMLWWLGFDCALAGDVIPRFVGNPQISPKFNSPFDSYKTIKYCKKQCNSLARQAIVAATAK